MARYYPLLSLLCSATFLFQLSVSFPIGLPSIVDDNHRFTFNDIAKKNESNDLELYSHWYGHLKEPKHPKNLFDWGSIEDDSIDRIFRNMIVFELTRALTISNDKETASPEARSIVSQKAKEDPVTDSQTLLATTATASSTPSLAWMRGYPSSRLLYADVFQLRPPMLPTSPMTTPKSPESLTRDKNQLGKPNHPEKNETQRRIVQPLPKHWYYTMRSRNGRHHPKAIVRPHHGKGNHLEIERHVQVPHVRHNVTLFGFPGGDDAARPRSANLTHSTYTFRVFQNARSDKDVRDILDFVKMVILLIVFIMISKFCWLALKKYCSK